MIIDGKKITRSRMNRQVAGVAGGLGEYFNIDPTWVRIAFIAGTLAGGPGLIIYVILAIIMPNEY